MIDAGYVRALATDMIAGWIGGWTEPAEGEPQRRIVVEQAEPGVVTIRIEGARFTDEPDRRFAIAVEAEEVVT